MEEAQRARLDDEHRWRGPRPLCVTDCPSSRRCIFVLESSSNAARRRPLHARRTGCMSVAAFPGGSEEGSSRETRGNLHVSRRAGTPRCKWKQVCLRPHRIRGLAASNSRLSDQSLAWERPQKQHRIDCGGGSEALVGVSGRVWRQRDVGVRARVPVIGLIA